MAPSIPPAKTAPKRKRGRPRTQKQSSITQKHHELQLKARSLRPSFSAAPTLKHSTPEEDMLKPPKRNSIKFINVEEFSLPSVSKEVPWPDDKKKTRETEKWQGVSFLI